MHCPFSVWAVIRTSSQAYVQVREAGRIVPVAVTIAVGVNADGRRELLGMAIGSPDAEPLRLDFLRSLKRHGPPRSFAATPRAGTRSIV